MFNSSNTVVGILGTNGSVLSSKMTSEEALNIAGYNTGNLIYQYAVSEQIKNPKIHIVDDGKSSIGYFKEVIDVLVFPAANQLNPEWDLHRFADIIEKIDKPVIVVGLGGQSNLSSMNKVILQPGTVRFLKVVSERSEIIGFRGQESMELAHRYGVYNTCITGCPSNFINLNVTGSSILNKIKGFSEIDQPEVGLLKGTLEDYSLGVEGLIYNIVSRFLKLIIHQTNFKIASFLLDKIEDDGFFEYINWEYSAVQPDETRIDYFGKLRNISKYFFNASGWMDECSRLDVNIGQRIHGAIAAIQGGGLGVCVAFDARTKELVETMGYPHLSPEDVIKASNIWDLISRVNFDQQFFDQQRTVLLNNMRYVYEQHGVISNLNESDKKDV